MESIIIYLSHTARDENTTLRIPSPGVEDGSVKDVLDLAVERFNTVFGKETHTYTVDSVILRLGEEMMGGSPFTLREEDAFWECVDQGQKVYLTLKGNIEAIPSAVTTSPGVKGKAEEGSTSVPQNINTSTHFQVKEVHSSRIVVPGNNLKQALRGVIPISGLYKNNDVEIPVNELLAYKSKIDKELKEEGDDAPGSLKALAEWLEKEAAIKREHVDKMMEDGVISFWDLWQVFTADTQIIASDDDIEQGYRIVSCEYAKSWQGVQFCVTGEYVASNGKTFFFKNASLDIPMYDGTKALEDLALQIPTKEQIERLVTRGREIAANVRLCGYYDYNGQFRVPQGWRGTLKLTERGKIMIDIDNYNRAIDTACGNDHFVGTNANAITGNGDRGIGDDDVLFTFYAWLPAFSFRKKRWGMIAWELVSDIDYNHSAFDALVMQDEDQKSLIRGLVKQRLITAGAKVSEDLISGKGGGCIFLLYGPPGTGKTLTAEATAELLERPLYQITVAELGTDAEDLEEGLENALRLASHWKAVVLMDEADNFLERRGKNDLARNAMVSVFLRLLEYYDGVLFLTTNRVEDFDPAFYSRISMPIMYPALTREVRTRVWVNLLKAAKSTVGDGITIDVLAEFNLNGREIRSCIYLAQCTSQFNGGDPYVLGSKELLVPIHLKLGFREAMEGQSTIE